MKLLLPNEFGSADQSDAANVEDICEAFNPAEAGIVLLHGIYRALRFAKNCLNGEQNERPKIAGDVVAKLCDQQLI